MGQQLPYLPGGQNPYGQQFPAASANVPAQTPAMPGLPNPAAMPGGMGQPGALPNQPGIPGVDPQMMQAAQQSLANPNGGDLMSSIFPGPKELGEGAAVGIGTALAFSELDKHKVFDNLATGLDKYSGGKWLANKYNLDHKVQKIEGKPWLREFLLSDATITPQDLAQLTDKSAAGIEALKQKKMHEAVTKMEHRHLSRVMKDFENQFAKNPQMTSHLKSAYSQLLKDVGHGHNYLQSVSRPTDPLKRGVISNAPGFDKTLEQFSEEMKSIVKASGKKNIKIKSDPYKAYATILHSDDAQLKKTAQEKWLQYWKPEHQGALGDLSRQFEYLDAKVNKTDADKALCKLLRQTRESAESIGKYYTPIFESQAKLTAELSAKGVGPVGRTARSFTNYLQRIFRGDTMQMGSGGLFKNAGHLFGPALMGAFIFGFSFQTAKNAKDGEKKQAFFHNLLGAQIFNFIGWEFGRKLLNAMNFRGILGRFAKKLPFGMFRKVPILGMASGLTLGGIVTEMVAMLVIGGLFQKVGEKVSHAIFGKPSQASIDGKGNTPPTAPGQAQPGQSQNQNQGQNPYPALSGTINPALMNQAFSPAGRAPYASNPGFPAASQAYPMATPAMRPNPQPYAAPTTPMANYGTPAARAPQLPPPPKFSLTPAQISQNRAANDYNTYYSKLKSDKTLDKRPGELLDKM